ncbi:MAG: hypothetical protein HY981_01310 [Candidatus Magasanikbacteria bacterium]|nr:hypothetical protein [Candidatus Magasanikbacteria bacterium]
MHQVLSLSLPATEVRQMKHIAGRRGYASVSSYVNFLFQADKELISETELLKAVRSARKEYSRGKSIKARSIADLL